MSPFTKRKWGDNHLLRLPAAACVRDPAQHPAPSPPSVTPGAQVTHAKPRPHGKVTGTPRTMNFTPGGTPGNAILRKIPDSFLSCNFLTLKTAWSNSLALNAGMTEWDSVYGKGLGNLKSCVSVNDQMCSFQLNKCEPGCAKAAQSCTVFARLSLPHPCPAPQRAWDRQQDSRDPVGPEGGFRAVGGEARETSCSGPSSCDRYKCLL